MCSYVYLPTIKLHILYNVYDIISLCTWYKYICVYINVFFTFARYHLQALRHLYVLAAERRVLVTVDSDSGRTCSVPVRVITNHSELTAMSPCIVPSWEDITEVVVTSVTWL